jgi:hypothetical protein
MILAGVGEGHALTMSSGPGYNQDDSSGTACLSLCLDPENIS